MFSAICYHLYNLKNVKNIHGGVLLSVKFQAFSFEIVQSWKYNIRGNANSDFSIVTMRRVAIIFFELGVVKNSMQKF